MVLGTRCCRCCTTRVLGAVLGTVGVGAVAKLKLKES